MEPQDPGSGILDRIIYQIMEGTYNIGAWAIFVGRSRGYTKAIQDFYAAYFAGIFMMGSIVILQQRLTENGGHDNA